MVHVGRTLDFPKLESLKMSYQQESQNVEGSNVTYPLLDTINFVLG